MCSTNLLNLCTKNIELNAILNNYDLTVTDNLGCYSLSCYVRYSVAAESIVSFSKVNGNLAILFAVSKVSLVECSLSKALYFVAPVTG